MMMVPVWIAKGREVVKRIGGGTGGIFDFIVPMCVTLHIEGLI